MNVSINAAWVLRDLWARLDKEYDEENNNLLNATDAKELAKTSSALRHTLMAEALEVTAFFPNEKRYNADHLFTKPEIIFGTETFSRLPENARYDYSEACKCILVERGTAAAFHLMRGTEASLKHLYFSVVKRGRHDPAMWANMVAHLTKRHALDEGCRGMLDVFRRGFRNPTAHPEKQYSVDEAQDLLGTTIQLAALISSQKGYQLPPANSLTD